MEAEWWVEMGEDLPRIIVPWAEGGLEYLDLRLDPAAADALAETQHLPALATALRQLNAPGSQVFTSKCDVWEVDPDDMDPLEMEAAASDTKAGFACYIDLVRQGRAAHAPFAEQEAWLKHTRAAMLGLPAPCARAELVLRQAILSANDLEPIDGFGVTLYVTGCGSNEGHARNHWETALGEVVKVFSPAR
jgi:hypothetical protein